MLTRTILRIIVLGSLGAVLAVSLVGGVRFRVSAVDARLRVLPSLHGVTEVRVPLLGSGVAETHHAPVRVLVTVEEVSLGGAQKMLTSGLNETVLKQEVARGVRKALLEFALQTLLLALGGGGLLYWLVFRKQSHREWAWAGVSGALVMIIALGATYLTYDTQALKKPKLTGVLEEMPWALKIVREGYVRLDTLDTQLRDAAQRMFGVYDKLGKLEQDSGNGGDETRILVISDIHNNLIAIKLAARIATFFDVSAVVNAGDLTDLGSLQEKEAVLALREIARPQAIVAGNHESPEIMAIARKQPGLTVLDSQLARVAGIKFLGMSDPCSRVRGVRALLSTPEQVRAAKKELRELLDRTRPKPDVLVVHDPRISAWAAGRVPVIIYGDTHMLLIGERNGTVFLNPGTTGASGVRYFTQIGAAPMSAVVLHMSKGAEPKPISVDVLEFKNPDGEFAFRHLRLHPEAGKERLVATRS